MTPLPDVPGVLSLKFIHDVGEDANAVCVVHFEYSGAAPTPAEAASIASSANGAYITNLKPLLNTNYSLREIIVTDLSSSTGAVGQVSSGTPGGLVGQILTAETCALINFKIGRRYRGGHPRIYMPFGVQESLQDPQTWTAAFSGNVTTGWGNFVIAFQATPSPPTIGNQCNVSYYEGGDWVPREPSGRYVFVPKQRDTPLIDPVVSASCNAKPASQRRRMLRGG
jgi:hypothetical protein